jgi:hypothetical protein
MTPLADPEACWLVWRGLRRAFPLALAACATPTHVVVLAELQRPLAARRSLARLLGHAARRSRVVGAWKTVPEPVPVTMRSQLLRHVLEVSATPCREAHTSDPLAWPWSTHRGVLGAELEPWVSAERLAGALGLEPDGFVEGFHALVAGAAGGGPASRELPTPTSAAEVPQLPLERVIRAAASATPWSGVTTFRRVAVDLAHHQGWTSSEVLALALGVSPRTVRRLGGRAVVHGARSARLCVGDERLLFDPLVARAAAAAATASAALRSARGAGCP